MNIPIADHPYIGKRRVYSPPGYDSHPDVHNNGTAWRGESNVIVAPGMVIDILSVFKNWNNVSGLYMFYVYVPATREHTHIVPSDTIGLVNV